MFKEILNKQQFILDNYEDDDDDDEFTDEIDLKEAENQGFTVWGFPGSDIEDSSDEEDIFYSSDEEDNDDSTLVIDNTKFIKK